jgi:hypothetical protein
MPGGCDEGFQEHLTQWLTAGTVVMDCIEKRVMNRGAFEQD